MYGRLDRGDFLDCGIRTLEQEANAEQGDRGQADSDSGKGVVVCRFGHGDSPENVLQIYRHCYTK
jgi:hypothetical protein